MLFDAVLHTSGEYLQHISYRSDPTKADTDGDEFLDNEDNRPTTMFDDRFFVVNDYSYTPSIDFVIRHYENGLLCYDSDPLSPETALSLREIQLLEAKYSVYAAGGLTRLLNFGKLFELKDPSLMLKESPKYSELLAKYLIGAGETYTFSENEVAEIIGSHTANREHHSYNINQVRCAIEEIISSKHTIDNPLIISTTSDSSFKLACYKGHNCATHNPINTEKTGYYYDNATALDYGYSLGESLCGMTGTAFIHDGKYVLIVRTYLIDTYEFAVHWDPIECVELEEELHSLHEYGAAKEFLMNGMLEETFVWNPGEIILPEDYKEIVLDEGQYD